MITCVLVFAQVAVQGTLDARASDSFSYSLVSQQLILSTDMTDRASQLQIYSVNDSVAMAKSLAISLQKFETAHWNMQLGKRLGNVPKKQSPEALLLFKSIDIPFDQILTQGRVLVSKLKDVNTPELKSVAQKLGEALKSYRSVLGKILVQYDEEFSAGIFYFKMAEIFVLGGLLTILAVSFWFFFRPAVNNMDSMVGALASQGDVALVPEATKYIVDREQKAAGED
jgi:hypothetical protein